MLGQLGHRLLPRLAPIWRQVPSWLQWRVMWLLNAKFAIGVSGVVFDDQGRVLLLKHTFRRRYPWSIVSGWVKGGEALEAALHREIQEETKLSVAVERLLFVRSDRLSLFLEAVFICRFAGGSFVPSNEVTEARWCLPDALPLGTHPRHGPLIRRAAAERARAHEAAGAHRAGADRGQRDGLAHSP
jgi:ADP-ribose pyrophosphatase YjhB (NUDIX family)